MYTSRRLPHTDLPVPIMCVCRCCNVTSRRRRRGQGSIGGGLQGDVWQRAMCAVSQGHGAFVSAWLLAPRHAGQSRICSVRILFTRYLGSSTVRYGSKERCICVMLEPLACFTTNSHAFVMCVRVYCTCMVGMAWHGCSRKHHLSFRTAEATWVGGAVSVGAPTAKSLNALSQHASPAVGGFDVGEFLGGLSPDQRCVLGFPAVGDPYWCEETLAGVAEKYGGALDVGPYAKAAGLLSTHAAAKL